MIVVIILFLLILIYLYFNQPKIQQIGASIPAAAMPRMTFQYPMTPPWHFYQSPWMMYQNPWLLSKETYQRYAVPDYFSPITLRGHDQVDQILTN